MVTVNHNAPEATLAFLDSLQRAAGPSEIRVIVVDSASTPDCLAAMRAKIAQIPHCELLESAENRGYFGGARFGLDHFLRRGGALPAWVIVCNNDVVIQNAKFVEKLLEIDPSEVGVVAPRIRSSDLTNDQNPFMRKPPGRFRQVTWLLVHSNYASAVLWDWLSRLRLLLRSKLQKDKWVKNATSNAGKEPIYAPHGSFLIFSRRYFASGGYLDPSLFLYGEEVSVAEICRHLRLPVMYDPRLVVLHNDHSTLGPRITRFSFECQRHATHHMWNTYWSDKRDAWVWRNISAGSPAGSSPEKDC